MLQGFLFFLLPELDDILGSGHQLQNVGEGFPLKRPVQGSQQNHLHKSEH
jgi:hypothetical protein